MIYGIMYSASVRFNPVSYWCSSGGKLASPFATGAVGVKRILDHEETESAAVGSAEQVKRGRVTTHP